MTLDPSSRLATKAPTTSGADPDTRKPATLDSAKCAAAVKRSWILPALLALAAPLAIDAAHAALPAWKPDKAVELIAANAPGGGGDRILRIMAKVLQEQRQIEVPITVMNKPGGGNSVAYWEGILRRMGDSKEWKKELETNFWSSEYMGSVETRKYIERDSVQTRAFLVDLGLAK